MEVVSWPPSCERCRSTVNMNIHKMRKRLPEFLPWMVLLWQSTVWTATTTQRNTSSISQPTPNIQFASIITVPLKETRRRHHDNGELLRYHWPDTFRSRESLNASRLYSWCFNFLRGSAVERKITYLRGSLSLNPEVPIHRIQQLGE